MFKKLVSCLKGYVVPTILAPIFILGEVVMEALIPYKMADLIDKGIEVGNMEYVTQIGKTLLLLSVISLTLGALASITSSVAGAGFAKNLRHQMYEKISTFSFANVDKFSSSSLITRMTTDVARIRMAFMMGIRMAFRAPGMLIFSLVLAFKISNKLPWVFIAAIPLLAIAFYIIMTKGMPLFKAMFVKFDRLNQVIQENVRGIRVVKAYVREKDECEKFSDTATEVRDMSIKAERIVAFASPIMNLAMYGCMIGVAWLGAKFIVAGEMSTGQLTSMISYIMMILTSLLMLSIIFIQIMMAEASAVRIGEVLMEEPDIKNCDNPIMEVKDGSVEFKDVRFAYGEAKDCLRDIDLKFKSGETIGIIGGTGSGKTSLVQLIPRLYDAREGSVLVGGDNVKDIDLTVLRKSVAMVLQKNVLFSGTIRENMQWGKEDANDDEIWAALKLAQADKFVEKLEDGLDTMVAQGGTNFSGGQRQRLCIARALIGNPKILIFDDSTSAVDTATEKRIREGLLQYMPDTTKIIIGQRISSVKDADRIVVIDDGMVSGVGTHEDLLLFNKIYQEVYESQTKGGDFDEPQAE